ncbi:MAG: MFS transporter [Prevotellaceae bacterium]|jgi:GPH family glycoside/pentoside/hexuronide:cation symporter|nr:MFS transporter [Prevotellaceae bacterium]
MEKVSVKEKIAYALGDASANIAWRGVSIFLFIFYTDVFGLTPATVGLLFLLARFGDGVSDIFMGVIGDRTKSRYGNFRPWILWSALPLGIILSLLFTSPDWSMEWKIVYAYTTYILFTLVYTANNIPYGALMAVMTGDDKERTSIGSYRMAGAFAGGMVVQGSLLYLVAMFGNVNPAVSVTPVDSDRYEVVVSAPQDVENVNIKTKDGIALFRWNDASATDTVATADKSFSMESGVSYSFIVTGENGLDVSSISIIDQKQGYSKAIYTLSIVLVLCLFITFYYTRERITPPKEQENNLKRDFFDLIRNKPWLVMLIVGLLFNVYNAIKQGITVIYFTHYIHNQLLAASYMICLMLASIAGAMITAQLSRRFGKKNLFIGALLFSGTVNALLYFCSPQDTAAIFVIGIISEFAAAIFPTLFFVMLGDAADYSDYKNGRRATGLIYSAGSFATKFGGGVAGIITGAVLSCYGYKGGDAVAIQGASEGIVMLMSWVPAVVAVITAGFMCFYPLNQEKMDEITTQLTERRLKAKEFEEPILNSYL